MSRKSTVLSVMAMSLVISGVYGFIPAMTAYPTGTPEAAAFTPPSQTVRKLQIREFLPEPDVLTLDDYSVDFNRNGNALVLDESLLPLNEPIDVLPSGPKPATVPQLADQPAPALAPAPTLAPTPLPTPNPTPLPTPKPTPKPTPRPTPRPTPPPAVAPIVQSGRVYLGQFELTAYCACYICCGKHPGDPGYGITASGAHVQEGVTIAVDRNVIKLGTRVYIEGVGERVAQDVGGGVKGNRIDVYFNSHQKALQFGRRRGIPVYRLQ